MNSIVNHDMVCDTLEENHGSSTSNQTEGERHSGGLNADSNSLLWLKEIAIDNYSGDKSSIFHKESQSRILYARRIFYLTLDDAPWRKRKLNQFLQEEKNRDLLLEEKQKEKRRKYSITPPSDSEGSSDQILGGTTVRSQKFVDNLSQKRIPNCHSFPPEDDDDDNDVLPLLDSDDSISGSNMTCSKVRYSPYKKASSIYKAVISPRAGSSLDKPSAKFIDFFGDDGQMAIPVGPCFQAEIPTNNSKYSDDKWLGTPTWPTKGVKFDTENIGKGRPLSCCCVSRGGTECIKLHISERRQNLRNELSSVFYCWKFDDMGEDVSRGWTETEQEKFRSIVKANPLSEEKSFWKPAIRNFPGKSRESLVSYYFNVYVLGRMSRQTRLAAEVDSDDDETHAGNMASQSKDAKQRYLTGIR
ncbi:hypothetical protein ACHQM5_012021 [Ranunculus cassubicifolius]